MSKEPEVTVVGLGPAGIEYLSDAAKDAFETGTHCFIRTIKHPAAKALGTVESFDRFYETSDNFEQVYNKIVDYLVQMAISAFSSGGNVVYAVPGSPLVAERSVEKLRSDSRVRVKIVPAISFLDLCWDRLKIDPVAVGARIVDGTEFGLRPDFAMGSILVAQSWSRHVLSDIKLAWDADCMGDPPRVTLLHHLGLDDEVIQSVDWWDLDRTLEPDHLTSVWIHEYQQADRRSKDVTNRSYDSLSRTAFAMQDFEQLVETLRDQCPWDQEQTHVSLSSHLLEESYEVLEAIKALSDATSSKNPGTPGVLEASDHLCEELGDLLFQVAFHATLAKEDTHFELFDVITGVHNKLVARHPHVFGEHNVNDPKEVITNWEEIKRIEKGRESVTDGIPIDLPALLLASKLQQKASAIGLKSVDFEQGREWLVHSISNISNTGEDGGVSDDVIMTLETSSFEDQVVTHLGKEDLGMLLFGLADLVRRLGFDPEDALRTAALGFRDKIRAVEKRSNGQ